MWLSGKFELHLLDTTFIQKNKLIDFLSKLKNYN